MKRSRGAARLGNAPSTSPVLDCFMFSNELDVLEVRLAELEHVVDLFVLVEAPVTHQGKPKPLHFAQNAGRFARYRHKIRHVVVNDMPLGKNHWRRERHQREALRAAIADAGPHALVVVSDVDEIPRASTIALAREKRGFVFLELALNYYYFNLTAGPWLKAYAAPKQVIDRMTDLALPRWRELAYLEEIGRTSDDAVIRDAGWHFTWQGGVRAIMSKLDAFAHAEFRPLRDAALIERAMRDRHFFIGNEALHEMPTDRLPATVQENLAHYRQKGCLAPARRGRAGKGADRPPASCIASNGYGVDISPILPRHTGEVPRRGRRGKAANKVLRIPTSESEKAGLGPSPSGPPGHLPRLRGRKNKLA